MFYKYDTILKKGRPSLVKEISAYEAEKFIKTPQDAVEIITEVLRLQEKTEEYVFTLCMNTKGKLKGFFEVSHGGAASSLVDSKTVFGKALLIGTSNIILVHNHPSGDPTPSQEDINLTSRMAEIGRLLDLNLFDHLIVGGSESMLPHWISIRESNPDLWDSWN